MDKTITIPMWIWDMFAIMGIATVSFMTFVFVGWVVLRLKKRSQSISDDPIGEVDNNGHT